ncbi:unnamed protein product [Ixodes persulcatus]
MMPTMLQERRMLSNVFRLLWLVAAVLACGEVSWACRHCGTLRSLGPPPASIADMPPPPLPPLNPLLALVVRGDVNRTWDGSLCERVLRGAAPHGASPLEPSEWWLHPSTVVDGDRAWPLAVVMVAGSATILGSVLLLVLSRNKRWQPVRAPPVLNQYVQISKAIAACLAKGTRVFPLLCCPPKESWLARKYRQLARTTTLASRRAAMALPCCASSSRPPWPDTGHLLTPDFETTHTPGSKSGTA